MKNTNELSQNDLDFFAAVYELMDSQFPEMKEKFGIWKIHQHFEAQDNEVFFETSNPETQESTLRIIDKNDLPAEAHATTWKMTGTGPIVMEWCCDGPSTITVK